MFSRSVNRFCPAPFFVDISPTYHTKQIAKTLVTPNRLMLTYFKRPNPDFQIGDKVWPISRIEITNKPCNYDPIGLYAGKGVVARQI